MGSSRARKVALVHLDACFTKSVRFKLLYNSLDEQSEITCFYRIQEKEHGVPKNAAQWKYGGRN